MASQIRLGIIGCGFISHAHARAAIKSNGRVKMVAATSRNAQSLNSWCALYGAQGFATSAQMLSQMQLDGVIIATPPAQHFDAMVLCIAHGIKAILCEKPLITKVEDCKAIIEMAKSANCAVLEGFMYRHHSAFQEFQADAGSIGKLDTIFAEFNMNIDVSNKNWRQSDVASGGIAFDFLCYPVDFCNLFAQAKPKSIFAFGLKNQKTGLLEKLSGQILYENGVIATLRISQNSTFSQKIMLSGNLSQIEMPIGFAISNMAQINRTKTNKFIDQEVTTKNFELVNNDGTLSDSEAFARQLQHFGDIIENAQSPLCGLDAALKNTEVTHGLLSAIEIGLPFVFDNITPEFGNVK